MSVADVGAGTGFLTQMIAREVGAEGKVYAVDVVEEFLDLIAADAERAGIENLVTVLGDQKTTKLESGVADLILVCDAYHHFEFPQHTLASLHQALRLSGTLVVIDFERIEGKSAPFALGHIRAGKGTFTDEIKNAGFELEREIPLMEDEGQYVLVFAKR